MITNIQELNKQPVLADLLLVLMANQNTYMSTVELLQNGILSPASGIARLKKRGVIVETIYQSMVDKSGRPHKGVKQRAKLSRLGVETASNSFHLGM